MVSSKKKCFFSQNKGIHKCHFVAWGASDFVTTTVASGFEADEGFDSFLAMQAPPEVSLK